MTYGSLARRQENARTWDRAHRNRKVAEVRNVSISACGKSTLAAHKRPARSKNDWRQGTGGGTKKFAAEANAITKVPVGQTKPKSLPGKPKSLPGQPKSLPGKSCALQGTGGYTKKSPAGAIAITKVPAGKLLPLTYSPEMHAENGSRFAFLKHLTAICLCILRSPAAFYCRTITQRSFIDLPNLAQNAYLSHNRGLYCWY